MKITQKLLTRDDLRATNPNFGEFQFSEELVIISEFLGQLQVAYLLHRANTGEQVSFRYLAEQLAESLELEMDEFDRLHDIGLWIIHDREVQAMSESQREAHYAWKPSDEDIAYIQEQGFDFDAIVDKARANTEQREMEINLLKEIFENSDSGLDNS